VKAYLVGGAVRDELLGLPLKDRDYVVVGATPEEMVRQGYRPVGKDFPVFQHPGTHEEYALARTERKSGRGYKGFTVQASPEVTLEEDLRRRDLSINAMAKDADGALIDPFQGKKDLEEGVLRHVSEAFAEDPVRILRVARFAARFGFKVHEKTMRLMRDMVASGETDHLVPERVWQEFSKGLAESRPGRMFEVLEACGLLKKLFPFSGKINFKALEKAANDNALLPVRFALLAWPLDESEVEGLCERLRAPNDVRDLALLAGRNRERLRGAHGASPATLLELLKAADAFRRPERFADLLKVAQLAENLETERMERALRAASAVNAGEIAKKGGKIPQLIDEARVKAIAQSA
jgi:tRNA nucleotidyltransferase (CCA-adding enzyme)